VAVVLQLENPQLTKHVNIYHKNLPHYSARMHFSVNTKFIPHLSHCTPNHVICVVSDPGRDYSKTLSTLLAVSSATYK
jgi:hypothetical protein